MKHLIRAALEVRLATWAAQQTPALPVAWEDRPFSPSGPYLRVSMLPAEPDDPVLGQGLQRHQGVYQVSVFVPAGSGPVTAESKAANIAALYARGTVMTQGTTRVVIDRTPQVGRLMPDGPYSFIPVSIRYRADIFA